MQIVIKSGESDTTIANTIFNNLADGVGLYGSTTVTVKDLSDENVLISFTRATEVPIYFNIEVVLKDGYTIIPIINEIKNNIVNNFSYAMGERIIANDFYQYINIIEGIDYITTLEIKTGASGATYGQTVVIDYDEYGTVKADDITVAEE